MGLLMVEVLFAEKYKSSCKIRLRKCAKKKDKVFFKR